ncbi:molybdate ABC transporter permease subunit [Leptospira sp. 201903070]|jgi:molybdate transport system permease protein|uniref:Molybdenum transport system permease n=1 Tax=Leptospira ainlahdjerensis TaxID=2810033 RepID=A0ABS2UGB7_9LEPT|nr:molybdate ABC transporter permease subunit [Leptospira ainlahdjerensis]MBM9578839.1 molybdate ABC transporter permease subunit [Leptospira ainlahdjerensis]
MTLLDWENIRHPVLLTLSVSALSTSFATILGVLGAYLLCKSRFIGKELLDSILTLPLVLPPTVLGYYLLVLFGKKGFVGSFLTDYFHFSVLFHWSGAVIASVLVSFPLVYRSARAAFEEVDPDLEDTAKTLGKGNFAVFWEILLPLSWRGILAGAMLAYARGMGEFGATLMIAGNIPERTQTLSLAIYEAVQSGNEAVAFYLVVLTSILSVVILTTSTKLLKKPHW